MVQVTKSQFENLRKAGLIDDTKANRNYYITSHKKKSKRHKYYVTEDRKITAFLELGNKK